MNHETMTTIFNNLFEQSPVSSGHLSRDQPCGLGLGFASQHENISESVICVEDFVDYYDVVPTCITSDDVFGYLPCDQHTVSSDDLPGDQPTETSGDLPTETSGDLPTETSGDFACDQPSGNLPYDQPSELPPCDQGTEATSLKCDVLCDQTEDQICDKTTEAAVELSCEQRTVCSHPTGLCDQSCDLNESGDRPLDQPYFSSGSETLQNGGDQRSIRGGRKRRISKLKWSGNVCNIRDSSKLKGNAESIKQSEKLDDPMPESVSVEPHRHVQRRTHQDHTYCATRKISIEDSVSMICRNTQSSQSGITFAGRNGQPQSLKDTEKPGSKDMDESNKKLDESKQNYDELSMNFGSDGLNDDNRHNDHSYCMKKRIPFFRFNKHLVSKSLDDTLHLSLEKHENNEAVNDHGYSKNISQLYLCQVCGKECPSDYRFKKHMYTHSEDRWRDRYLCHICGKTYKFNIQLHNHIQGHFGNRPWKCDVCVKAFTNKTALAHHRVLHKNEKPFTCHVCDKTFRTSYLLKDHKNSHSGKNRCKCNVCGMILSTPGSLIRHKRAIHLGQKLHMCDICGKSFTYKTEVDFHKFQAHNVGSIIPFKCDVCQKVFGHPNQVKRHMAIHATVKPYSCDVCGRPFSDNGNLRAHKRIHTGERHYVCNVCQKAFIFPKHLRKHKCVESSEKASFKCGICSMTFSDLTILSTHLANHRSQTTNKSLPKMHENEHNDRIAFVEK